MAHFGVNKILTKLDHTSCISFLKTLTFKKLQIHTRDPPARETESTTFETLSRPPEKN
jgi:hypothetical protein